MSATVDYLRTVARYLYGNDPSLARLVLEFGYQAPRLIECPRCYRGRIKRCYNNAAETVLDNPRRYAYVEGYASSVIPVPHAWVWDRHADAFFDPTWHGPNAARNPDPSEYIGLVFRSPSFRRYVYRHTRAGLIMAEAHHAYQLMIDPRRRARALVPKVSGLWTPEAPGVTPPETLPEILDQLGATQ